jgi:hypothetical protein
VFPDEFHLQSLDKLDAALGQLQPGVAVGTVLTHLMTRLARYVADDQDVLPAMEQAVRALSALPPRSHPEKWAHTGGGKGLAFKPPPNANMISPT